MEFYLCEGETVLKTLGSSRKGLSEREAAARLKTYGENALTEEKRRGAVALFFAQFGDFMTILLMIAAGISAVLSFITKDRNDLADTVILLVIILLNNVVGFVQQYRADNAIEKMKNLSVCFVKVCRGGKECRIDGKLLVPGDIVYFEEGDRIPADCRILSAKNLKCNEAALTGESAEVEKSEQTILQTAALGDRKDMLYASTYAVRGSATAVVTETGMRTEIGRIAGLITHAEVIKTPLERALERLGKIISGCVVGIAAFLFVFGAFFRDVGLLPNFMSSVAVAVAAIPEGLPAVVTVLMALGVQKMSRHRAIVRRLQAVETLGACDCICCDKTGTLTENRMTVREIFSLGGDAEQRLFECMEYCNAVRGERGRYIGDGTEIALKNYLAERKIVLPSAEKRDEIPFDSDRKMMTVFVASGAGEMCYSKGAPEILLKKCRYVQDGGSVRSMTEADRRRFLHTSSLMARKALRVLGFACRTDGERKEEDLVFIGLCGMSDPPKKGAAEAVRACLEAGIGVVMITGDQRDTALSVARQLGIAQSFGELVTGEELDGLHGKALEERIFSARVFARVNSAHKAVIVKALQKRGKTVAMTGDGVNDAPAVKNADIGIAMGSGTDVTKNVADIVVTDNDFSTIVAAVSEGRHIFSNIRKTISFFLTTNLGEVLAVLAVTLFLFRYDFLNSTQLLWINLITDTFPVLALGAEAAERRSMHRPPQKAEKEMFSRRSLVPVLLFGVLQAAAVVGLFVWSLHAYGNAVALTMAFFAMSFCELFYALNIRTDASLLGRAFFGNKVLLLTIAAAVALNLLLCVFAPLRAAFGIVALTPAQWGIVFGVSLAVLPLGEAYKWGLRLFAARRGGEAKRAVGPIIGGIDRKQQM